MAAVIYEQADLLPDHMLGAARPVAAAGHHAVRAALPVEAPAGSGRRRDDPVLAGHRHPELHRTTRAWSRPSTWALYTAGIFVVQLFVLAFPVLLRDANATAADEIRGALGQ